MPPDPGSLLQEVFVGRQPIYGRRLELYAYELLYRGADVDFADFEEGDRATSNVLLNTFTEFGLERVVGAHLAFVNLTRGFVVGEYPLPVPKDRVVLEVLEDIEPDPDVLDGLKRLRQAGFRIALDDFEYDARFEPFLALADIVKVDVLGLSDAEIRRRLTKLRPYRCKLLAEKIESRRQFEACFEAGYDLFQGYFLARPNVLQGSSIGPSRLNLLRLLAALHSDGTTFDEVERIVSQDVTLSYKLLRHINSALYGMPRQIDSIRETVVYLGLSTVKNLASLFLLSTVDDKPHELMVTAMLRGHFCRGLARASGIREEEAYFAAGLFSTLDALLDISMERVLGQLPFSDDLAVALLEHRGPIGQALACVLAYEQGRWEDVAFGALSRAAIRAAFLDAVGWVEEVNVELAKLAA